MCHKALHEVAAARRRTADAHTQGDRRGADACPRTCTRGLRPSSRARHPYSKPKSVHRGATADNVGAHVSFDRLDLGSARPCSAPTHLISFRPGPYFRNAPNLRFYRVEQRSDEQRKVVSQTSQLTRSRKGNLLLRFQVSNRSVIAGVSPVLPAITGQASQPNPTVTSSRPPSAAVQQTRCPEAHGT